jgi:hypothetical protein
VQVNVESAQSAKQAINGSGGSMAFTETSASGHNAWTPAMREYQCFRWMLAQKRGSWFSPPPGIVVNSKPYSLLLVFFMFVLPFAISAFLLWDTICELVSNAWETIRSG